MSKREREKEDEARVRDELLRFLVLDAPSTLFGEKKKTSYLAASDSPSPREEHSASISSMKTIDGAFSRAMVNN